MDPGPLDAGDRDALFAMLAGGAAGSGEGPVFAKMQAVLADVFRLLAVRTAAEGLADPLRSQVAPGPVADSPFYALLRASDALLDSWLVGAGPGPAVAAWRAVSAPCVARMGEIRRHLQTEGSRVEVVLGLEALSRSLTLMEAMVAIMEAPPGDHRAAAMGRFREKWIESSRQEGNAVRRASRRLRLYAREIADRSLKSRSRRGHG